MKRALGTMGMIAAVLAAAVGHGQIVSKAQLRVSTDPDGATLSCDGIQQDVTPITLRDLDAGPHLIAVEKIGYSEVRKTVSLLPGQKSALEIKLEPITGLVLIQSVPDGAEIEVGGAHKGKAPVLLTDLPIGHYRVKASANGFISREMEFQVENRIPQQVKVSLTSDSATLVVSSTPPGAAVTVNGLGKGTTPCTVDRLPSGDNKVVISLQEYLPYQQDVKLQAGDEQKIDVTLKPQPAKLSVISTPPGARVFLNDKIRGQTPLAVDEIEPGTYTIRAELEGCEPQSSSVEIGRAETKVVDLQMVRNCGSLELVTDPPGVKVTVDGQDKGLTEAGAAEAPSQVMKVDMLPVGSHKLQLSKKGFFTVDRTFGVKTNEITGIREVMKRKFVADTVVRLKSTPSDVVVGILSRKLPNGDVELETKPGIFATIKAEDVLSVDPLAAEEKK